MKRSMIVSHCLLVLILILSVSASAAPARFGFKAGPALAKWTGSDATLRDDFSGATISPSFRTGYTVGAFASFEIAPSLSIQPELLYLMKGTKYEQGGEKVIFKIDYLEVPILFKYTFPTSGTVRPHLSTGPSFGLKVRSRIRAEFGSVSGEVDLRNVKSLDCSVVFGGGLDFLLDRGAVTFDARYLLGLTGLPGKEEGAEGADYVQIDKDVDVKHGTLLFLIGYMF